MTLQPRHDSSEQRRVAGVWSTRSPVYKPRALSDEESILLSKVVMGGGVFTELAASVLALAGGGGPIASVNQPLRNGFLPLYFALTPEGRAATPELNDLEKDQLASLFTVYGADPWRKDSVGRIALLAPDYPRNELLGAPFIDPLTRQIQGDKLHRELTREERVWLYCAYATFRDKQGLVNPLEEALFIRPKTPPRPGVDRRQLSELLTKPEPLRADEVPAFLASLQRLVKRTVLSPEVVVALLNTSFDMEGRLLSHRIADSEGCIRESGRLFVELGGRFDIPENGGDRYTAFHRSALSGLIDVLIDEGLYPKGASQHLTKQGDSMLHLYLSEGGDIPGTIEALSDSEMLKLRNRQGEFPLDVALRNSPTSVPTLLSLCGFFFQRDGLDDLPVSDRAGLEPWRRLLAVNREFFEGKGPFIIPPGAMFPGEVWGVMVAALTIDARNHGEKDYEAMLARLSPDDRATDLARNIPTLLLSAPINVMLNVAEIIDAGALEDPDPERAFHPNESELLVMLARPGLNEEQREQVTIALTSMRRFDLAGVNTVSAAVVDFWEDIGKAGFEFLNLKWDATTFMTGEGKITTLLQEFGFERLYVEGKPQHSFLLRGSHRSGTFAIERVRSEDREVLSVTELDDRTEVELNRTHLRVFHPDHGELVVRNSAPDGGRNRLSHPFYLIGAEMREKNAQGFAGLERRWSFDEIESFFTEGLSVSLYADGELGRELLGAQYLLGQYRAVMRNYHASYFDLHELTAYLDSEGDRRRLVGAYKSPGFGILVEALRDWWGRSKDIQLAVCSRRFPAWGELAELDINAETLAILESLATKRPSKKALQASPVYPFVEKALFSFGELIIRSSSSGDRARV